MKQRISVLVFILLCSSLITLAQTPTAVVNGQVRDTSGAALAHASVEVINDLTNVRYTTETNDEGIYSVPNLPPGTYHIRVSKEGFKAIVQPDITLNVQDAKAIGFTLPVGPISDTVTVEGGAPLINTESAAVSTVVDRQFAENLPMNGRSFQSLIQLTPGVVLTPINGNDTGQFSVNGQRASSNYWMVDGVGANIGISALATPGNGLGGALGSFNVLGGTNSLVSVDAMQEFRIQTSTYAPEFGRTPGGQISIVTRSGANQFHGTAFDYFRNDVLDSNDWFANFANLPKPKERQNDFGGTFSGPIIRDRTFFFFSYEGLRLRLPQTLLSSVPDLAARQNAIAAIQPFLNAFPQPNGPDNSATAIAQFNSSFSNPATLNAYSVRIDHKLNDKLNVFGRYNYSPSELDQRGSGQALSTVQPVKITTQTATAGLTWSIVPATANDFRFNYSSTDSSSSIYLDNFGGAVPPTTLPFPDPSFTTNNALFGVFIFSLGSNPIVSDGKNAGGRQQQINILDSLSMQSASHGLKFGVDFRRLSPEVLPRTYVLEPVFLSVPKAESGSLAFTVLQSNRDTTFLFRNLGLFAQDTWRIAAGLTVTYGLRWDVDFVPSTVNGPSLNALTGFNLNDLSNLALAPTGTRPYKTTYGNLAPRLGLAYQLSQSQSWMTVLRGGIGLFYDLATSELGNITALTEYPIGISTSISGGTYPLTPSQVAPPPIAPPDTRNGNTLYGFDPTLELPYTLQWNVAVEQALGRQQSLSASYIGSVGRRLIQTAFVSHPNANYASTQLVTNAAASDYNAFQLQLQRRLLNGLQSLASYTWSHSIDTASAGSLGSRSNGLVAGLDPNVNRGSSDFDIRHAISLGLTYDLPAPKRSVFAKTILHGWAAENVFQARSAPPFNVFYNSFSLLSNFSTQVRPNLVSGQPLYLFGSQYPGGKAINPAAFSAPPLGSNNQPTGQGNLGRNALRGFGAAQWDFAAHRDFTIRESTKLQFRAEFFNVLNHPNFAQPVGNLGSPSALNPQFGQSTQMLGRSLTGTTGFGGFNTLYQIGGPRSIQLALKLIF